MCIISQEDKPSKALQRISAYDLPGETMKPLKDYPPINVINVMRGFPTKDLKFQITPYRMQFPDGKVHVVENIRRMTTQTVGRSKHYHYVIQSKEQRYFHIVFDASILTWKLVQEVDEQLFFDRHQK